MVSLGWSASAAAQAQDRQAEEARTALRSGRQTRPERRRGCVERGRGWLACACVCVGGRGVGNAGFRVYGLAQGGGDVQVDEPLV
eukprot:102161-Chlamydomonas_euryale.AAC.2